jgi:hypothetical protein
MIILLEFNVHFQKLQYAYLPFERLIKTVKVKEIFLREYFKPDVLACERSDRVQLSLSAKRSIRHASIVLDINHDF